MSRRNRAARSVGISRLASLRTFTVEQLEVRNLMAVVSLGGAGTVATVVKPAATVPTAQAALMDDRYEQNDTFSTAINMGTLTTTKGISGLVLADESDWFRFTTTATGGSSAAASISFNGALGNLDVALYNSGGTRVRFSAGTGNSESISLTGLPAGTYYTRVYGNKGATNKSYSLSVNPSSTIVDDSYEDNDTRATAKDLGTLTTTTTVPNLIMADSNDWFKFSMTGAGTSSNSVKINFLQAQGNLDLELYNSAGTRVGLSNGTVDNESIALTGLAVGTYSVHILGVSGAFNPNYSLVVSPAVATTPPPDPGDPGSPGGSQFTITLTLTGLSTSQQAIFAQAATKWQSIIIGDLPDANYNGTPVDDVLIAASGATIDGPGGILGQAGPDAVRAGSFLPYHGAMEFDTADLVNLEASGLLLSVILHEMGHVLGVGSIWQDLGLLSGSGTNDPIFTGAQATAEYKSIFGLASATGVPVENTGGPGTREGHWRETVFGNELMTGYANVGSNPLSRITAASMADMGYVINISGADAYSPPTSAAAKAAALAATKSGRRFWSAGQESTPLFVADGATDRSNQATGLANATVQQESASSRPRLNRSLAVDLVLGAGSVRSDASVIAAKYRLASSLTDSDDPLNAALESDEFDLSWLPSSRKAIARTN